MFKVNNKTPAGRHFEQVNTGWVKSRTATSEIKSVRIKIEEKVNSNKKSEIGVSNQVTG